MTKYKNIPMVHLHTHSQYSELDSVSKVSDIVKRAKEYGNSALAISDHGTISSQIEAYEECKKAGIKWLPSAEFYHMPDPAKAKEEKNRRNHHLILIAMDNEGWTNIKKLTTKANEQFYYAPRIGYKDIEEHSGGLICMTACLKGIVPYCVAEEKYDEAYEHARKLHGIFGDRFYMELQDGGLDVQIKVNEVMRRMAEKLGVRTVGAQDAHYVERDDVEGHEGIWAIRTRNTFDDPIGYGPREDLEGQKTRPYYSTREYWLKDAHHILKEPLTTEKGATRFSTLTQKEIEESAAIADRCGVVEIEKKMHLPKYPFVPQEDQVGCAAAQCVEIRSEEVQDNFDYLCKLVIVGYERAYQRSWLDRTEEHKERLARELKDIHDAGLADYFLIVWDVVLWARSEGIAVGVGRGSAAGAMTSYCLGITGVDPLKYGLLWERFYNAGRKGSLADIDLDFDKRERDRVIEYIKERFGTDRVAQIGTFNTLAAKAALKDTAKILGKQGGMSFEDANVMTRFIPTNHGLTVTIKESLEKSDKLKEYAEKYPRLFKVAQKLEGCPKSRGTHAAGVLISDEPFSNGFPLRWNPKEGKLMTEWDMDILDKLQYCKLDCLALKTLSVLTDIENMVNKEK